MEKIIIEGGNVLEGTVRMNGAKNSAVALLPATRLADSTVTIDGVAQRSDVGTLTRILSDDRGEVTADGEHQKLSINPSQVESIPLPNGKVKQLRASYYFMGAMLGKFKRAAIGLPGGCYLGPRP